MDINENQRNAIKVNVTISGSSISYKYCNTKSMSYSISNGNSIKIIPGISTKMACIGLSLTESQFDGVFLFVVRYEKREIY